MSCSYPSWLPPHSCQLTLKYLLNIMAVPGEDAFKWQNFTMPPALSTCGAGTCYRSIFIAIYYSKVELPSCHIISQTAVFLRYWHQDLLKPWVTRHGPIYYHFMGKGKERPLPGKGEKQLTAVMKKPSWIPQSELLSLWGHKTSHRCFPRGVSLPFWDRLCA